MKKEELPKIKISRERTAGGIDWPSIIRLMVAARAKDPETTIFQPFTTGYLNDLVETAVDFATAAEAPKTGPDQSQREAPKKIELRLKRFTWEMETRMRANSHKGDWRDQSRGYLIDRLDRAVDDLKISLSGGAWPETTIRRAADVANYAMMIADQEIKKISAETITREEERK